MSKYVEHTLQPGETIVYRGRASKVALLIHPLVWLGITLVAVSLVGNKGNDTPNDQVNGWTVAGAVATLSFFFALWGLVKAWWFATHAEYAVTDRRVVGKYGFLRTVSVDVMMTNVAGVTVAQRTLGKIFNYGNVWVNGSGARRLLVGIKKPIAFQHAVYAQLDKSRLLKGTAAYTLDVRIDPTSFPTSTAALAPPPPPVPHSPNGFAAPSATAAPAVLPAFCSQCGSALVRNARFCSSCSTPVAG